MNVHFVADNLNTIMNNVNFLMAQADGVQDFVIKMDTDEFLTFYNESSQTVEFDHVTAHLDELFVNGSMYTLAHSDYMSPTLGQCNTMTPESDISLVANHSMGVHPMRLQKVFFDSSSFLSTDLGLVLIEFFDVASHLNSPAY